MNTLYHYVGLVIVWLVIVLAAGIGAFFLSLLLLGVYRTSWLYEAWQVAKTWYYYEHLRTKEADPEGLTAVENDLLSKSWWQNPFRYWWIGFFKRERDRINPNPSLENNPQVNQ